MFFLILASSFPVFLFLQNGLCFLSPMTVCHLDLLNFRYLLQTINVGPIHRALWDSLLNFLLTIVYLLGTRKPQN